MNDATLLADWIRTLRELARRAGNKDVLEALDVEAGGFHRAGIHLAVAGKANAGKSTRINALLGRNVLPVSSVGSAAGIALGHAEKEEVVTEGQSKPLPALASILREAKGNVDVAVTNDWLAAAGIRILERPPLDAADDGIDAMVKAALRGADVALLVIDALGPLTRADAALIAECARRELPLVLALSKSDHLTADERASVVEYVEQHVAGMGLELPLIEDTAHLREVIEATIASADLPRVRRRQAKEALLDLLSTLELAAHGGIEAQALSDAQRAEELRKREQKLETQTLAWMQVEQRLTLRRQKVDEQVREYLANNRASTLDALAFDLERSSDVHQWWTRDLPYRLQRELHGVAGQVSNSISRQVAADVRWLQEELHRQFKFPVSPLLEPEMDVDEVRVAPSQVALSNMQTFRVVSRVGTAATVVLAGIALAHTGVAGATIAVSSLTGLIAEQLAQRVAAKDRAGVRMELDRVLQRAWLELAAQISAKLKAGYDDLVATLKKEQARWHESQVQALRTPTPLAAATDWKAILDQTRTLATELASEAA